MTRIFPFPSWLAVWAERGIAITGAANHWPRGDVNCASPQSASWSRRGTTNAAATSATTTTIQLPYTARVVANGKVSAMTTPQTNGDCNSCHTQRGDNVAPGRILLP